MPKEREKNIYCENPFHYSRLKTRKVYVGNVPLGDKLPIRIQSMTNTSTKDTRASVDQCIQISDEGADLIRLTAINVSEAENLAKIKNDRYIAELYSTGRLIYDEVPQVKEALQNIEEFIMDLNFGDES